MAIEKDEFTDAAMTFTNMLEVSGYAVAQTIKTESAPHPRDPDDGRVQHREGLRGIVCVRGRRGPQAAASAGTECLAPPDGEAGLGRVRFGFAERNQGGNGFRCWLQIPGVYPLVPGRMRRNFARCRSADD